MRDRTVEFTRAGSGYTCSVCGGRIEQGGKCYAIFTRGGDWWGSVRRVGYCHIYCYQK